MITTTNAAATKAALAIELAPSTAKVVPVLAVNYSDAARALFTT